MTIFCKSVEKALKIMVVPMVQVLRTEPGGGGFRRRSGRAFHEVIGIRLNNYMTFWDVKSVIGLWINEYNTNRHHQELGYSAGVEYKLSFITLKICRGIHRHSCQIDK